ncbi:SRPBCC family protein [Actinotalea sp. Marseille-Q4924]|uniref:SRPBCC family protein n=1 Tax=Actinotalea sp. Marseille-Q4924 TaxID=2866571 RepID=UPI001CE405C3|nr:SRPBCC family protein [Actinotalea sp. Marseille-Q4924]
MTTRTLDRPGTARTLAATAAAVGVAAASVYPRARRWGRTFGATPAEVAATLEGDSLLPDAHAVATRAVDIAAPPSDVWPWVAQLGQGRAGFYSYDVLETLAGCDIRSADRVEPAWQDVQVGDPFPLHPEFALEVALVDPPRALVALGKAPSAEEATVPYDFSWAFVLRPGAVGTRLLVRERYVYLTRSAPALVEGFSWVSLLMTERMLRGIRDRAEVAPAP